MQTCPGVLESRGDGRRPTACSRSASLEDNERIRFRPKLEDGLLTAAAGFGGDIRAGSHTPGYSDRGNAPIRL